jgi:hypothetical protein
MLARAYKKASTPSFLPLGFLPRPATTLLEFEICISQLPPCSGDDSDEIKPSPSLYLVQLFFPLSYASVWHAVSSRRVPGRRVTPHLDITVRERISGEQLPEHLTSSSSCTSPPRPPLPSASPGKNIGAQKPLLASLLTVPRTAPPHLLTPVTPLHWYRKQESKSCTPSSSPSPSERRHHAR